MTEENLNNEEWKMHNFAEPDHWLARYDTIDDFMSATFHQCIKSLSFIGEPLSAKQLVQYFPPQFQSRYETVIDQYADSEESDAPIKFADAVWALEPASGADRYLDHILTSSVRRRLVSLSSVDTYVSKDIQFELTQIFNIYVLTSKLNNFFWGPIRGEMESLLANHQEANTPAPLSLLRQCFNLAGADAVLLQNTLAQRQWYIDPFSNGYDRSEQSQALMVMDKLTLGSLAPFQSRLLNGRQIIPITHLGHRTFMRRVPYSDEFLIVGVSYDNAALKINERWYSEEDKVKPPLPAFEVMAIPHEAGHFVYHYAELKDGRTFKEISDSFEKNSSYKWREEIFADVYGCMIGGPLTPLGLQAMLATTNKYHFWEDDGEHPVPIVRPYILSEMLRVFNEKDPERFPFKHAADSLDRNWTAILNQSGFKLIIEDGNLHPHWVKLLTEVEVYSEEFLNVNQAIAHARAIIEVYVTHLLDHIDFQAYESTSLQITTADFPWVKEDHIDLTKYNADMERLTGSDVAFASVSNYDVSEGGNYLWHKDPHATAEQNIQAFLSGWDDGGAGGSSGGMH